MSATIATSLTSWLTSTAAPGRLSRMQTWKRSRGLPRTCVRARFCRLIPITPSMTGMKTAWQRWNFPVHVQGWLSPAHIARLRAAAGPMTPQHGSLALRRTYARRIQRRWISLPIGFRMPMTTTVPPSAARSSCSCRQLGSASIVELSSSSPTLTTMQTYTR